MVIKYTQFNNKLHTGKDYFTVLTSKGSNSVTITVPQGKCAYICKYKSAKLHIKCAVKIIFKQLKIAE